MTTAIDLSCPLCAAFSITDASKRGGGEASVREVHAAIAFGWWMAQNSGNHDRICAAHREQFKQIEHIFGTPAGGDTQATLPAPPPHAACEHDGSTLRIAPQDGISLLFGTDSAEQLEWCRACGGLKYDGAWMLPTAQGQ